MEKTFAGFWRDGTVVKPEGKHFDKKNFVIVKNKARDTVDLCQQCFERWEFFYWLDTTTPEELTPQEAFECYKTLYPNATEIRKTSDGYTAQLGDGKHVINWGNTTEYPPRQRWRVPTDNDKGKKCRCKHKHDDEWKYERVFITEFEGKFLAKVVADNSKTSYAMCEVIDE